MFASAATRGAVLLAVSAVLLHVHLVAFDLVIINDDFVAQFAWFKQFSEAIGQGDLYPRWMPRDQSGLGDPAFVFYAPSTYQVGALLSLLLKSHWAAMKGVLLLATWLAGLLGFLWARRRGLNCAVLLGVLLQCAPFMVFVLFRHNGWAWYCSYPLFLFLLLYGLELAEDSFIDSWLALGVAALVLTHVLSAFVALLCLPLAYTARKRWRQLGVWTRSAGLGVGLASAYLIPAVLSLDQIRSEAWTTGADYEWQYHFALPLFRALTQGTSADPRLWVLPAIVLPPLLVLTWTDLEHGLPARQRAQLVALRNVGLWSFFLSTELSFPIWYVADPVLRFVQFPWRFLYVATAAGLIGCFLCVTSLRHRTRTRLSFAISPLVLSAAGGVGLLVYGVVSIAQPIPTFISEATSFPGRPEYLPTTSTDQWPGYLQAGGMDGECSLHELECASVHKSSKLYQWEIHAAQGSSLRVPVFAFPNWISRLDGKVCDSEIDESTGLVKIQVPEGRHTVSLRWEPSVVEWVGRSLSGTCLVLLVGLALVSSRSTSRTKAKGFGKV